MSASAAPASTPSLQLLSGNGAASLKLGLRLPGVRPSTPRLDEYAGLERLDREELDEDFTPPSRRRVA
jgi:hypothetical protein